MRAKLTPAFAQKAAPPVTGDRVIYWDEKDTGFGLVVTINGHRSFVVQYRAGRRSKRMHLKAGLTLSDARREAKAILGAVAKGGDPLADRRKAAAAGADTLQWIVEEYFRVALKMKRDAEGRPVFPENGTLRSARHRLAILERLILPVLGRYPIGDIKRSDLIRLFDKIAEENGEVMSDHCLAIMRKILNWHQARDDDFISPIRPGMARTRPSERARDRTLSDDELRAVWRAAETQGGPWGTLLRFLLLTAARRNEARNMVRAELLKSVEVPGEKTILLVTSTKGMQPDVWLIPGSRVKIKREVLLPLSAAAQDVLAKVPVLGKGEFVFSADGHRPIGGLTIRKREFDEACGVQGWTLHDLRRTARSLMSRAGVTSDHAERCLGHKIGGVRAVYDRYEYYDEKRDAFERLAALIERIVNPQPNVLPMTKKRGT
jgi:integrase